MSTFVKHITNEEDMAAFGMSLAALLKSGAVIYLNGQLGAGKTTLARSVLRGFGFTGKVKSPTYALVESYALNELDIHHFDFYRLADEEELMHLGVEDYFSESNICFVEWPEKAETFLPTPDLFCDILVDGVERDLKISAETAKGEVILAALSSL